MKQRILCILTLLCLTVSLIGCDKTEKLVGTWETQMDISDYVWQAISEELGEEGAGKFRIEQLMITVELTFDKDGTYRMALEEASAESVKAKLINQMKAGFTGYMELYLKENGYASLDEVLSAANMTKEEFERKMEEYLTGMESDLDVTEFTRDSVSSGTYAVTGGKLYMAKDGTALDETEPCEDFSVTDDTLIIAEEQGETVFTRKSDKASSAE